MDRRSFSLTLMQSGAFAALTPDAQRLYFYLMLATDDYGFVPSGKRCALSADISPGFLSELTAAGFLYAFPVDVYLVRHFQMNSYIAEGRRKRSLFSGYLSGLLCIEGVYYKKDEESEGSKEGASPKETEEGSAPISNEAENETKKTASFFCTQSACKTNVSPSFPSLPPSPPKSEAKRS